MGGSVRLARAHSLRGTPASSRGEQLVLVMAGSSPDCLGRAGPASTQGLIIRFEPSLSLSRCGASAGSRRVECPLAPPSRDFLCAPKDRRTPGVSRASPHLASGLAARRPGLEPLRSSSPPRKSRISVPLSGVPHFGSRLSSSHDNVRHAADRGSALISTRFARRAGSHFAGKCAGGSFEC